MTETARAKMMAGRWYSCIDDELEQMRITARIACHQHTTLPPDDRQAMAPALRALFASVGAECWIEAPFHCSYGINTHLGDNVYLNAGCVILDSAAVRIGSQTMLGPGVQIYCADHHRDADKRCAGLERALPVTIGHQVWIGGGAILLPGVTVGDRAIIGAGSVVSRDVPQDATVAGIPARAV